MGQSHFLKCQLAKNKLVSVATQLLQQKLTVEPLDGTQKSMMIIGANKPF